MSPIFKVPRAVHAVSDNTLSSAESRPADTTQAALRAASKLVEKSAYEAAGDQDTSIVSQLIMIAADLERLAQTIENPRGDD